MIDNALSYVLHVS